MDNVKHIIYHKKHLYKHTQEQVKHIIYNKDFKIY